MASSAPRRRVRVEARAKLNLGLQVGPRRPDGYHDLITVFQSISLADTLTITPRRRGFTLAVRHESAAVRGAPPAGRALVPAGADNLVLRAAAAFAALTGLDAGAHFQLTKRIPVQAGLGGGSADAAATLAGLRALYRVPIAGARLASLALTLGSDVPFALTGGTALGRGRGERLARLELTRPFRALVVLPRWRISTAAAFARLDRAGRNYSLTAWRSKLRSAQLLGRLQLSARTSLRLGNTFEETLGRKRREFLSICARIRAAGATEVRMTGSGSAVFGILEPGISSTEVVSRFEGREALFVVRTARAGLRTTMVP